MASTLVAIPCLSCLKMSAVFLPDHHVCATACPEIFYDLLEENFKRASCSVLRLLSWQLQSGGKSYYRKVTVTSLEFVCCYV